MVSNVSILITSTLPIGICQTLIIWTIFIYLRRFYSRHLLVMYVFFVPCRSVLSFNFVHIIRVPTTTSCVKCAQYKTVLFFPAHVTAFPKQYVNGDTQSGERYWSVQWINSRIRYNARMPYSAIVPRCSVHLESINHSSTHYLIHIRISRMPFFIYKLPHHRHMFLEHPALVVIKFEQVLWLGRGSMCG